MGWRLLSSWELMIYDEDSIRIQQYRQLRQSFYKYRIYIRHQRFIEDEQMLDTISKDALRMNVFTLERPKWAQTTIMFGYRVNRVSQIRVNDQR